MTHYIAALAGVAKNLEQAADELRLMPSHLEQLKGTLPDGDESDRFIELSCAQERRTVESAQGFEGLAASLQKIVDELRESDGEDAQE